MHTEKKYLLILITCLFCHSIGFGQSSIWKKTIDNKNSVFTLEEDVFFQILENVPSESQLSHLEEAPIIELPSPSGELLSFHIFETPLFETLPNKDFLRFRTYSGSMKNNPSVQLKMEWTPEGLSAFVVEERGKSWWILPTGQETYQLKLKQGKPVEHECFSSPLDFSKKPREKINFSFSGELYIYRLALAASGEYFQFWGNRDSTLTALVRTVNQMNLIFERDLAIRFQLIDDIQFILFDNPLTDPYELNGNQGVQNQQFLDQNVGTDEYDLGHVLMVDEVANGFGSVGSVCEEGRKGRGYSVLPDPSDGNYLIDFLAHELGHQLGGNHTFSHCADAGPGIIPVEPGSGSTIMAYGGLSFCEDDNFVDNSSPYFHSASIEEIYQYTRSGAGNTCPTIINFPNNAPEVSLEYSEVSIPYLTPFELSGSAVDEQGDTLSYVWEQMDQAVSLPLGQIRAGSPLFRSIAPNQDSVRVFPNLQSLIDGETFPEEKIPNFSGDLNFRLTVRDNHFRGGGVSWEESTLSVTDQAGPFRVLSAKNEALTWGLGLDYLIQWEVANTNQAPVNAEQVDLFFVYDSTGLEVDPFKLREVKLAGPIPNNGEVLFEIPTSVEPGRGWLKIKGHQSPFFDLSDHPITLTLTVSENHVEETEERIKVFPNPAKDFVFIEKIGATAIEEVIVEWIDVFGRSIERREIELGMEPSRMNVPENLSAGWYFIQIHSTNPSIWKIRIR